MSVLSRVRVSVFLRSAGRLIMVFLSTATSLVIVSSPHKKLHTILPLNILLVGGGWASHRIFLRSRDPRLARYIESSL